jgi:hypothetical protein
MMPANYVVSVSAMLDTTCENYGYLTVQMFHKVVHVQVLAGF